MKIRLTLFLSACAYLAAAQTTVITGEIRKKTDDPLVLGYWKDFSFIQDTIKPDENNTFKKRYTLEKPSYIWFNSISPSLIFPGDTLHLVVNGRETLLEGNAAAYPLFWDNLRGEIGRFPKGTDLDTMVKYAFEKSDRFFSAFKHREVETIRKMNNLNILVSFKLYPLLVRYSNNKDKMDSIRNFIKMQGSNSAYQDNSSLLSFFNRVDFNSEFISYDINSLSMINNLVRILRFEAVKDSSLKDVDSYLVEKDIIKDMFRDTPFRTVLLGYNLYNRIEGYVHYPAYLGAVPDFISEFKKESHSEELVQAISRIYQEKLATIGTLEKGIIAPGFRLRDMHGNMVSLADFKGKAVYLDIWASWCGPCLKEIPYLKTLKEKYRGKNIEIVSISIDTKEQNWRKKIEEFKLDGIQLIDDTGDMKSKTASSYGLSGVPQFVLIDKEGRIAEADAPRPSVKTIEDKINELLK